jgi:hypothetical protein
LIVVIVERAPHTSVAQPHKTQVHPYRIAAPTRQERHQDIIMARRGSSMFAPPGAGGPSAPGIGLVDFEDDYDSEEEAPPKPAAPKLPPNNNPSAPGGRPMVGGFAAAAYEAAKAHHFAQQQAKAKAAAQKQRSGGN